MKTAELEQPKLIAVANGRKGGGAPRLVAIEAFLAELRSRCSG